MPMMSPPYPELTDAEGRTVVAVDDLSVQLGGLPVLRGITLSVSAGEAVALLGGNGSGKSTLVRTLVGLIPTQRGSVQLFGRPLAQFRQWSRVGYVPQRSTTGMSGAKVREVVASGRLSHRRPFVPPRAEDRRAVAQALDAVGLQDRAGDDLAVLSGGQQQRVLIARALAGRPELLILDEPNAGVDLAHQQVLAGLLSNLIEAGTAVLVVLHEIGPLGRLIDRAVVLSEGRVAHDGALSAVAPAHPRAGHEHADLDHPASWLGGAVER
jgi:zinc transport system ATP-binding protein